MEADSVNMRSYASASAFESIFVYGKHITLIILALFVALGQEITNLLRLINKRHFDVSDARVCLHENNTVTLIGDTEANYI